MKIKIKSFDYVIVVTINGGLYTITSAELETEGERLPDETDIQSVIQSVLINREQ